MSIAEKPTAIVTGAGTGIGFAIAELLATEGIRVILNDLDEALAATAAARIREKGGQCIAVAGDSSDLEVIDRMVEAAVREFGSLDIAVANAGITTFGDFFEYRPEDFQRLINVNLKGSFFLAQASARKMRSQGRGGRIIFTSSVTGIQAHQRLEAYGMTKAALQMLARSLVSVLGPHGITTNAVAPGATLTERTAVEMDDYAGTWGKFIPTGRVSRPEDIAQAVFFLASPAAAQITGQTLVVDGGWTATGPLPKFFEK